MRWTLGVIAKDCGAKAQVAETFADVPVGGVSIDTRSLRPGDLFVALDGEKADGHNFVDQAMSAGASAALVKQSWLEERDQPGSFPVLSVPDPLTALQSWANRERNRQNYRVVAITGSSGKTTAKEMIASVLQRKYRVAKTAGNLNNHLGVPLTLLGFEPTSEVCVVEMGANHQGEIDMLSRMVCPDIGVVLNVGYAHIGLFGTLEKTADAKFEIANGLSDGGCLILNGDDPRLRSRGNSSQHESVYFSRQDANAYVHCEEINLRNDGKPEFTAAGVRFRLPVPGLHMMDNALAAIAVGLRFQIPVIEMAATLEEFEPVSGRWSIRRAGGVTIVDDAYNANPSSVEASLETVSQMATKGRRIAVLGDMLELGEYSRGLHEDIGGKAYSAGISLLCVVGEFSQATAAGWRRAGGAASDCVQLDDTEGLTGLMRDRVSSGDLVLFKASQRMGLQAVAGALEKELQGQRE